MAQPVGERPKEFVDSGFSAPLAGSALFWPDGLWHFLEHLARCFELLFRLPLLKRARVPSDTLRGALGYVCVPRDGLIIKLALKRRPDRAMIGRLHHRSCFVINIRFCELLEHRL